MGSGWDLVRQSHSEVITESLLTDQGFCAEVGVWGLHSVVNWCSNTEWTSLCRGYFCRTRPHTDARTRTHTEKQRERGPGCDCFSIRHALPLSLLIGRMPVPRPALTDASPACQWMPSPSVIPPLALYLRKQSSFLWMLSKESAPM